VMAKPTQTIQARTGGVEIKGLAELIKDFGGLPDEVERISRRVVTGIEAQVRTKARANAPVESGLLKRSIKSRGVKSRSQKGVHWGEVFIDSSRKPSDDQKDPFYWRFLEYGTESIPARPFIQPAARQVQNDLERIMSAEVAKQVDKEIGKRK